MSIAHTCLQQFIIHHHQTHRQRNFTDTCRVFLQEILTYLMSHLWTKWLYWHYVTNSRARHIVINGCLKLWMQRCNELKWYNIHNKRSKWRTTYRYCKRGGTKLRHHGHLQTYFFNKHCCFVFERPWFLISGPAHNLRWYFTQSDKRYLQIFHVESFAMSHPSMQLNYAVEVSR